MTRQIIALGGGGFSMEESPLLDDFVLACARRTPPRICFIPTASGDAAPYIARFYRAFSTRHCVPTDLTLFGSQALPRQPPGTADLEAFVMAQDVIYVGGGNTANLLAMWRAHGLDRILRSAWEAGVVLAGVSAGMICWFASSVTDSFGAVAPLHDGLGLIATSACPHYDGEPTRRPRYQALIASGFPAGYAADDGAALHFIDDQLHEVVVSRPNATAYWVERVNDVAVERALPTRMLGAQLK